MEENKMEITAQQLMLPSTYQFSLAHSQSLQCGLYSIFKHTALRIYSVACVFLVQLIPYVHHMFQLGKDKINDIRILSSLKYY